ncbi:MAG: cytochrome c maturation protein CcmE [Achromobacter sp.]|jgi:cytochrome c-type biogenesis protein CcmE|uniref:Cytochrome c-type biogenesis protein CcmE n=1 Tax=Achromobacter insuavis TaxID=1287735 RepID=A0A6J5AMB1_9BURK|nr:MULTISPECIES: cytochrome c maturation protein CcmE [Achromobacter]MBN9641499.1 cytochrome c maturation protein CcmE [Achromobacter sp.]CAB3674383.1 Cytochrome c-type biogenesis protein CcmE [Achromobacter insuavis]CUJ41312.1 Heme chaperone CcmE [Achromobacter sp. 2789STDY5608633]CUJ74218.1 Heme chaperone CcmE [Achromobacter sp. 2789STDY5608628]
MPTRRKRLFLLLGALALLASAVALMLTAMRQNLVFFHTPSEIARGEAPRERLLRIGGLVQAGSLRRQADGLTVRFVITDTARSVSVTYRGSLPDLFQEGKGVVAQGMLGGDGVFVATSVLARHDENYTPVEAQHALDRAHDAEKTLQR